jgi:hypothetical protein
MAIDKEPSAAPGNPSPPTRTEQQEALLQEALARPGISEVMRVYENWKEQDRAQEPYREAMRDPPVIIATDHVNVDPSRL